MGGSRHSGAGQVGRQELVDVVRGPSLDGDGLLRPLRRLHYEAREGAVVGQVDRQVGVRPGLGFHEGEQLGVPPQQVLADHQDAGGVRRRAGVGRAARLTLRHQSRVLHDLAKAVTGGAEERLCEAVFGAGGDHNCRREGAEEAPQHRPSDGGHGGRAKKTKGSAFS